MSQTTRPTFIGIHTKDEEMQILYVSSGCQQAIGFSPESMISHGAHEFIADPYATKYSQIYHDNADDKGDDGDASAYVMYINLVTTSNIPVLHRITSFKCDNCIIFIGMAFPELPCRSKQELQVQLLDGAMRRLKFNFEEREKEAISKRRHDANKNKVPLYFAKNRQVKAAFVLEDPVDEDQSNILERRQNGPLVVFVTGSISRIIDADTADLVRFPFLKLIAPEDLIKASKFFENLRSTPDVLFETFSMLHNPSIIDGDILISDEANRRVEVECLGANVSDGLALLIRKIRVKRAPRDPNNLDEDYAHSKVAEIDSDGGYMSLSEIISSDPETSDAPGWSRLR